MEMPSWVNIIMVWPSSTLVGLMVATSNLGSVEFALESGVLDWETVVSGFDGAAIAGGADCECKDPTHRKETATPSRAIIGNFSRCFTNSFMAKSLDLDSCPLATRDRSINAGKGVDQI